MSETIQALRDAASFCIEMSQGHQGKATEPISELATVMFMDTYKEGHVAGLYRYELPHRWMWCAREFDKKVRQAERELLAKAMQMETELASLRAICKRILATYDSSGYTKGSVQELWREFQGEVEK